MAQIPNSRLVKGPYKPICRDCTIYFSSTLAPLYPAKQGWHDPSSPPWQVSVDRYMATVAVWQRLKAVAEGDVLSGPHGAIDCSNKTQPGQGSSLLNYTPVIQHSNEKWTLGRCISYWKCGYFIAMLVYRRVTSILTNFSPIPTQLGSFSQFLPWYCLILPRVSSDHPMWLSTMVSCCPLTRVGLVINGLVYSLN